MRWYFSMFCLLGLGYGFVIISSASNQQQETIVQELSHVFRAGQCARYKFTSNLIIVHEQHVENNYQLISNARVSVVWHDKDTDTKLVKVRIDNQTLHTQSGRTANSRKSQHMPSIQESTIWTFIAQFQHGEVKSVFLNPHDSAALRNMYKGFAYMLEMHLPGGLCSKVPKDLSKCFKKSTIGPRNIYEHTEHKQIRHPPSNVSPILQVTSDLKTYRHFEIDTASNTLQESTIDDHLILSNPLLLNGGGTIEVHVHQTLTLDTVLPDEPTADTFSLALNDNRLIKDDAINSLHPIQVDSSTTKKLTVTVRENSAFLQANALGTIEGTQTCMDLIDVARIASADHVASVLKTEKHKIVLPQIMDVLGHAHTEHVHQQVMKQIRFEDEQVQDLSERYLWALAVHTHPSQDILRDVLKRYQSYGVNFPVKVQETILLTLAAMAQKCQSRSLYMQVHEMLINELDYYSNDETKIPRYIRALGNLKSETVLPILVPFATSESAKISVTALKAILAIPSDIWSEDVPHTARKIFFQKRRAYDSSSRTLAFDILLKSNLNATDIEEILNYVHYYQRFNAEVRQYVLQQFSRMQIAIPMDPTAINYASPSGLSTALQRQFLQSSRLNGSIVTVQEIVGGVAKRGIVNIQLQQDGKQTLTLFSLGLFSSGLNSYMSTSSNDVDSDPNAEEPSVNAGMELSMLDVQLRPFVFFDGSGELMGHLWSGTASEKTPAFQAFVLLQDHIEHESLRSGIVLRNYVRSAATLDLSGKIEVSIWSRTADMLVEKSTGFISKYDIMIQSSFIHLLISTTTNTEPQLSIKADGKLSGKPQFCMRVSQPDIEVRRHTRQEEKLYGNKTGREFYRQETFRISGVTYALTRKNDQMCTSMFSE